MNRARVVLGLSTGALATFLVPFVLASCAGTENGEGPPPTSNPLPAPQSDASLPGTCDAGDPNCVDEVIPCSEVPWCPTQTNVESLYSLTKVWGASPNDVWAVGAGATVIHWDGANWTRTPVPPALPNPLEVKNTFLSIWGRGPNDVWIASTTSTIYRKTGSGWVHQPAPLRYELPVKALWGDGPDRVRVGARAYQYEAVIDGQNYLLTGNQLTTSTVGEPKWEFHEGTAWIFGYYGTPDNLWLIGDNRYGNDWQRAFVQNGRRLADGGFEWTQSEVYSLVNLHAIWGSSADDIWAVGDQGTMRRLRAGQTEWEMVPPVTNESLHAIWGTSATNIWVAGENGTILHYDGNEWTPQRAAFPAGKKKPLLTGIWGSGPDDVWIVGGHVALHYDGKNVSGGRK
ncbi:MAG: hypothetical protein BGO98_24485 [Myxococcales bacterium 68-20]|nr:hypothetical protein [Myxococcales bacterium]OJY15827.1 MAG: hypothetical protein BGO98_24485 [Myxococcales bacterium 68-20]